MNAAEPRDLGALRGLTMRPPSPAAPPPPVDEDVVPAPAPRAPRPRQKAAPARPAPTGKRSVPVYLAATAKARLEELARAGGVTLTEWVLDTLDDVDAELPDHFAPVVERRSGLPPRTRVVRPRAEASSSVQLRLTDAEVEFVDRRTVELGVPSRSALLSKVVDLGIARATRPTS